MWNKSSTRYLASKEQLSIFQNHVNGTLFGCSVAVLFKSFYVDHIWTDLWKFNKPEARQALHDTNVNPGLQTSPSKKEIW